MSGLWRGAAHHVLLPLPGILPLVSCQKVYEVDPMLCPQCGSTMKAVAFLTEYTVVDRIIEHLRLTFVTDRPPPPQAAYQELMMAANPPGKYFS